MQIEARAPVARVRMGIHSVSGGEAAGAVALAHHWPAAILAERHGSWYWRAHRTDSDSSKLRGPSLSSRQSSEPRRRPWRRRPHMPLRMDRRGAVLLPVCGGMCRSGDIGSATRAHTQIHTRVEGGTNRPARGGRRIEARAVTHRTRLC